MCMVSVCIHLMKRNEEEIEKKKLLYSIVVFIQFG